MKLSYVTSSSVLLLLHLSVTYIMNLFLALLYLNFGIIFVYAQNDGRYRPVGSFVTTKRPVVINDGRYNPGNDGKYRPANDGKYRPGNDGKYIHIGDKDRGQYSGGGGEYTGGGGQYTGTGSNGGQYTGNGGDYNGGFGKDNGGNVKSTPDKIPQIDRRIGIVTSTTVKPKAAPQSLGNGDKEGWKIIRDEKTEDTDGYHYLYETENGILAEESGRIENLTPNENGLRSKGFYQYTGDDGVLYRVDYVADNNGFVPQGDHIPKTPPAIQKLLDYLASQS